MEDCYVARSQRRGCDAIQGNVFRASSHCDSRDSSPAGCSACRRARENACASSGARAPSRRGNIEATGKYSVQGATMRKIIWIKSAKSELWSCSRCAWAFKPSGPPHGNSLDEMMQNFERQRDQQFASHVCAEHPPTKGQERQNEPRVRGRSDDQAES
jgi:hypothetical protein